MTVRFGAAFEGEREQPFFWEAGPDSVLFVHGFPGTPGEVRAIAERVHEAGWTVQGLLLPGFGSQIDSIFEYTPDDWIEAVSAALRALRARSRYVHLLGYSVGAAVAIQAAAGEPVDRLALAAPFTRLGGPRERVAWEVMRRIFPRFKPFRSLDFQRADIRAGVRSILPQVDLDDQEVQSFLRDLAVPSRWVHQLLQIGLAGPETAGEIRSPVLIVQGDRDRVVQPQFTQELVVRFRPPAEYLVVDAAHELLEPGSEAFETIAAAVVRFLGAKSH